MAKAPLAFQQDPWLFPQRLKQLILPGLSVHSKYSIFLYFFGQKFQYAGEMILVFSSANDLGEKYKLVVNLPINDNKKGRCKRPFQSIKKQLLFFFSFLFTTARFSRSCTTFLLTVSATGRCF